jgi:hypothetical protein
MKLEFSRHIFETYSNTTFHENPSIWRRVFPCGALDVRTDMKQTLLTILQKAPKNGPDSAALGQISAAFSSDVRVKF